MNKLSFWSVAIFGLTSCAAMAANSTSAIRSSKIKVALPQQQISEAPVNPAFAANASFGAALEEAIASPSPMSVTDPSGKFAVQVSNDNAGRIIRVITLGSNQARDWRLGSGSGDLVVEATVAEVMSATGQSLPRQLEGTGSIGAQKLR